VRIGAGGMGTVYRARDTRLDREVALKIVSDPQGAASDLRQRFEREARAVSRLNHPHICSLYDTGTHDDIDFIIFEYVEGETLASRIARRSLPLHQALEYALQIATALDYAHRHGIVHRDLKPSNVMVTRTGVKVLDFGIAKLMTPPFGRAGGAEPEPGVTHSMATAAGTIVGTVQYMAPEQLEGQAVDARADVFAFGALFYEMLAGRPAFDGPTPASVIGAVLEREPDFDALEGSAIPAGVVRLIHDCLVKDRDARWQSLHDAALELESVTAASGGLTASGSPPRARAAGWRRAAAWAAAGLALGLIAATAWSRTRPAATTAAGAPLRATIGLDPGDNVRPAGLAISPAGDTLVYVAIRDGRQQLFSRRLDEFASKPLAGTEDAVQPFFSPDGEWIAFFTPSELKKVPVAGGPARALCVVTPVARGGSWGDDGRIVFSPTYAVGLSVVSAEGGAASALSKVAVDKGEVAHLWPQVLPGAKWVLFTVGVPGSADRSRIAVRSLETGEQRIVLENGSYARYAPSGHLVYAWSGTIMAAPFDLTSLSVTGQPKPMVSGLGVNPASGSAQFAFTADGTLVYAAGAFPPPTHRLVWVDRRGVATPAGGVSRTILGSPVISPNGRDALFSTTENTNDVWLYEIDRGALSRLTFDDSQDWGPIWSPDGQQLAYTSVKPNHRPRTVVRQARGGGERFLVDLTSPNFPTSWSSGGAVAITVATGNGNDIWIANVKAGDAAKPFVESTFSEHGGVFSPDGKWLAFVSNESGRFDVYVKPFPGPGPHRLVSTGGGNSPRWARSGRELFYRNGRTMMAVDLSFHPDFKAGTPKALFEGDYQNMSRPDISGSFDVSEDGRRFLMVEDVRRTEPGVSLRVMSRWFDELAAKLGR
jgi:Tol biopolymer transport system component